MRRVFEQCCQVVSAQVSVMSIQVLEAGRSILDAPQGVDIILFPTLGHSQSYGHTGSGHKSGLDSTACNTVSSYLLVDAYRYPVFIL